MEEIVAERLFQVPGGKVIMCQVPRASVGMRLCAGLRIEDSGARGTVGPIGDGNLLG